MKTLSLPCQKKGKWIWVLSPLKLLYSSSVLQQTTIWRRTSHGSCFSRQNNDGILILSLCFFVYNLCTQSLWRTALRTSMRVCQIEQNWKILDVLASPKCFISTFLFYLNDSFIDHILEQSFHYTSLKYYLIFKIYELQFYKFSEYAGQSVLQTFPLSLIFQRVTFCASIRTLVDRSNHKLGVLYEEDTRDLSIYSV